MKRNKVTMKSAIVCMKLKSKPMKRSRAEVSAVLATILVAITTSKRFSKAMQRRVRTLRRCITQMG